MKKLKNLLSIFICFIFVITLSCAANIPNIQHNLINISKDEINKQELYKKIIEVVKNKKFYQGPIDIRINTGLSLKENKPNNSGKVFSVQSYDNSFDIKSIPLGSIIVQKTFTLGTKESDIKIDFKVSDISKRYLFYIKRENEKSENDTITGTININSFNWINPVDFKGKINSEIIKDSLLLNSNNSISVKLTGPKGSTISIAVIEGGPAGIIKKLKKPLGEHDTNEKHIKVNDTNLFDPSDSNSLNELEVNNNDVVNGKVVKISSALINSTDKIKFEAGTVIAQFKDETGLSIFKSRYNATVVDTLDKYYKLKIDFSKSPIQNTESIIREYNKYIPIDISDAEFSSLASMQTFMVILDFLTHYPNLTKNITLSVYQDLPVSPPVTPNDWIISPSIFKSSWHLNFTNTLSAWNYSIGTGTTVAWIDSSTFKPEHPEISRRIIYSYQNKNALDADISCIFSCDNEEQKYHGHFALMTGFAERGNNIPTAGSAPNAKVIPYGAYLPWDFARAVADARVKKVDVIGLNQNWQVVPVWGLFVFLAELEETLYNAGPLEFEIKDAVNNDKIPVIVPAHNYAKNIMGSSFLGIRVGNWFPSCLDEVIVVGSVTPVQIAGSLDYKSNYQINLPNSEGYKIYGKISGSNYGRSDMIWAPGDTIDVAPQSLPSTDKSKNVNGTSFANPFITGVVALLKSRNKKLLPAEIKNILIDSSNLSGHFVHPHPNMIADGFKEDVRLIDVEEAVKEAIKLNETGITDPQNSPYFPKNIDGEIHINGNNKSILIDGENIDTPLIQSINTQDWDSLKSGDKVNLKGWNSKDTIIGDGESGFEILGFTFKTKSIGGENIPVVGDNTKTLVIPGQTVAAQIPTSLGLPLIENTNVLIGDHYRVTIKSIVDQYVLFNVPPNIPETAQDVIISIAGGGSVTYKQALEIIAAAAGLKPSGPVTFPNGDTINPDQFVDNDLNTSPVKVEKGGLFGLAVNGDINLNDISIFADGHRCTLQSVVQNYALYRISPEVDSGVKNLIIEQAGGGSITFEQALEILAESGTGANPDAFNKIIAIGFDNGSNLIYKIDPDTEEYKILTSASHIGAIGWSSDKNKIAFSENGIFTINPDGTDKTKIADITNTIYTYDIKWSPDGKKIAVNMYIDDRYQQIIIMDPDGSNFKQLTTDNSNNNYFNWSSDSSKIVFLSDRDGQNRNYIYLMNSDGTNQTKIVEDQEIGNVSPSFLSKQNKIIFGGKGSEIYSVNFDGSNKVQLTHNTDAGIGFVNDTSIVESPDGKKIAFSAIGNGSLKIFTMNTDGTEFKDVTENTDYHYGINFSWSPDNKRIVYTPYNSNLIYVVNADGTNRRQILSELIVIQPKFSIKGFNKANTPIIKW